MLHPLANGRVDVPRDMNIAIGDGARVTIAEPSGSSKTPLLLSGLERTTKGPAVADQSPCFLCSDALASSHALRQPKRNSTRQNTQLLAQVSNMLDRHRPTRRKEFFVIVQFLLQLLRGAYLI